MGIKKNLIRLMRLPTSMRIADVVNIMQFMGYNLKRINGSHHYFLSKDLTDALSVPVKNGKVKLVYLKLIKEIYEKFYSQN